MDSESGTRWPGVFRTAHMPGGLRAVEIGPTVVKFGPMIAGEATLTTTDFASLGKDLRRLTGLLPLGVEYFRTDEEIDGKAQSDWRCILPRQQNKWPTHEAELNWSGLSNSARLRGDSRLYLIAGSITSQNRFAAMRLLDLSNLYRRNIECVIASGMDMAENVVMRGYHADLLFSSIHAAFFEIATLRDYLAEYIAFAVFGDKDVDAFNKLSGLVRKRGTATALEAEIDAIYNQQSGWLFQFSERRNTLAHRMPFDRLSGGGAMHFKSHDMPIGGTAWLLHVPVPEPVAIRHKDDFTLPVDVEHQANEFIDATRQAASRADTMAYLFKTFQALVDFGNRLLPTFPYPPEMVTITDEDIVSVHFGDRSPGVG